MSRLAGWQDGLEASLVALAEAERAAFGGLPGHRPFRRLGRWIVAEAAFSELRRDEGVLQGAFRGAPRALAAVRLRMAPRMMLPSAAAALLLKSNLRAFYPDRRATLKIADPRRSRAAARLRNEALKRRGLADTVHVTVPRLLQKADPAHDGFLLEEMVQGRPLHRGALPPAQLAAQLIEFQRANGLRIEDASAVFAVDESWRMLREYLQQQGIGIGEAAVEGMTGLLARGRQGPLPVAVAVTNNDLTISNLLSTARKIAIIDWEYAGPAPAFVDAVRLSTQIEGYAAAFAAEFEAQMAREKEAMLPATEQFMLSVLAVCRQRIERRGDFETEGERTAYETRLRRRILDFVALLEGLASRG